MTFRDTSSKLELPEKKNLRVALVFFNSLSENCSEFWGNSSVSIISGALNNMKVKNDIFAVFMKDRRKPEAMQVLVIIAQQENNHH